MARIEVNELQARTSDVLRRVSEQGETIDVTEGGKVVARVTPVEAASAEEGTRDIADRQAAIDAWLARAGKLAAEIGSRWPKGVSAVDAVRDVRRDL